MLNAGRNRSPQGATVPLDMGMLMTEVATRLRSGADMPTAWRLTLTRTGFDLEGGPVLDDDGVPVALRALAHGRGRGQRSRRLSADERAALPAAIAVCRLTHVSGAPAADILEACAAGITEASEAAGARRAALAGPLVSARMLAFLPVLGLALGMLLGADPLRFLLGSGIGMICLASGIVFDLVGVIWIARLSSRARAGM